MEEAAPTEPTEAEPASETKKSLSVRDLNTLIRGTLTLRTATRDIDLDIDGDVAMRILTVFHDQSTRRYWTDRSDPNNTLALEDYIAVDMAQVVLMTWTADTIPAGHHSDSNHHRSRRRTPDDADSRTDG